VLSIGYRPTMAEDGQGPGLPEAEKVNKDVGELISGLDSLAVSSEGFDADTLPTKKDKKAKSFTVPVKSLGSITVGGQSEKKRKREEEDEGLAIVHFVPLLPTEDCPLCCIPLPRRPDQRIYVACCGQKFCGACFRETERVLEVANTKRAEKKLKPLPWQCPFCRAPRYKSDEYKIRCYEKRVEKDDINALFVLAYFCRHGRYGLVKDLRRSCALLRRAADLGDVAAIGELGRMYAFGVEGVSLDETRGREYLERAAKKGNTLALINLGALEERKGRTELALTYFRTAAAAGDDHAIDRLKKKFRAGKLSKDDLLKSMWAHHDANEDMRSEGRERFKRWKKAQEEKKKQAS